MIPRAPRQSERQRRHTADSTSGFGCAAAAIAALLLVCPPGTHSAHAQTDTPAARQARAALRNVADSYSSRSGWATWSRRLALEDVEYELQLGDRAEPAVLQSTAAQLRRGRH